MPDEVLTIKEVAALLKLAEKTVYAMANGGDSSVQDTRAVAHQADRARPVARRAAAWSWR